MIERASQFRVRTRSIGIGTSGGCTPNSNRGSPFDGNTWTWKWKFVELLENFWNYLEILRIAWKYLELLGNIWNYLKIFGITWKYLELFGNMWNYLEICGLTWKYLEVLGNIWNDLKIFGSTGIFWKYLEIKVEVEVGVHDFRSRFTSRYMYTIYY